MNFQLPPDAILRDVLAPRSLIADAGAFGGARKGEFLRGDLVFRGGRAVGMIAGPPMGEAPRIILPRLTECHVHLDKCHTAHRLNAIGGDLAAAIALQAEDRRNWVADDIRARAERGLNELIEAGCGAVRTHVDWVGDPTPADAPVAWHVLTELAQDYRDRVILQIAPLTGVEDMVDPGAADALARLAAAGTGVLGVYLFDQPDRAAAVANAFRLADKYELALDFHVDEGLVDGLDGLRLIAEAAIAASFQGPVICGHACSLANLTGDPLKTQIELLSRSGVAVATLPATNLYLQGRVAGTPDRRGLTRVRELRAAGVPVIVGTDNVRDAFCPLGQHDPMHSLSLAALAAHLDPPFSDHLPMIGPAAAAAMGLAPTFIDGARVEDLLLADTVNMADLISGAVPRAPLADTMREAVA